MPATPSDLIRQALKERAATITPDNLIYRDMRSPEHAAASTVRSNGRRGVTLLAVAAAAVAVLAIVLGSYAFTRGLGNQTPAAGSGDQLTGIRWRLTEVRSGNQTVAIPANYRAELSFYDNGRVSGLNGLNAFDGTYHTSGQTITISVTTEGGAGQAGISDVIEAVDSLYVPDNSAPQDNAVDSRYTVSADTLTIRTPTWTLTFSNNGAESTNPPASPTPSATSSSPQAPAASTGP